MTRINLINPEKLTDQHLLAEYRELPRIFWIVRKKISENKEIKVWKKYKMWTWHVIFFYDKLLFLQKRLEKISSECKKRNFKISFTEKINLDEFPENLKKDFSPSKRDLEISEKRIKEKLDSKKNFYKYYWKIIDEKVI